MKCFLTIILNLTLEENGIVVNKKANVVKAASLKILPMVCKLQLLNQEMGRLFIGLYLL